MNKISVMIVDDEKLAVEDLISLFNWEANGFEIIAKEYNGEQALDKFRKISPQIVITDIKMPFMDGLELIREIRKLDSQTKILLLSAYSEFDYAKLAIDQGVVDYLIKSEVNEQAITNKLLKLKEQITSENITSDLISQKVITDLFNNGFDRLNLKALSNPKVKRLLTTPYCYFIIEEDLPLTLATNNGYKYESHHEYEIISCCMSVSFSDYYIECASFIHDNQILLLIQSNSDPSQYSIQSALITYAKAIQQKLETFLQSSFSVFILYNKMCLKEAYETYLHLRNRMYSKYLLGCGRIYDLQDKKLDWTLKGTSVDEVRLSEYIDKLDRDTLLSYIDELYAHVLPPDMDYNSLVAVSQSLYMLLKKYFEALPPTADSGINLSRDRAYWLDAKGIKNWIKYMFESLIDERYKQLKSRFSREVIKAIAFIHKYFDSKELKISQIADNVGLSSGRLSVLFKKETGSTINEFITNYRIKKAKELLDKGSYKIYEIATMIGYGSSQYFSQVFYFATGVRPSDYMKGKR